MSVDELKKKIREHKVLEVTPITGLSTGSTLLNLACSGYPNWGLMKGGYYFFVGDSASGKSIETLTMLAEASINSDFDKYRLIFDNAENGVLMDLSKFFGSKMVERLEPPAGKADRPIYSSTVEGFYYNLDNAFEQGKPFVYLLDSMDSLTTSDEFAKFEENKTKAEKGKEASGSYGTSKAKLNSSYMRIAHNKLRDSGSILIVISQTRDNIGFGSQFNPKTRAGGNALTFYAQLEMWSSVKGHIKKTVRSKPREQGILCQIRVKKNRLTGRDRTVIIPIYHSIGIDDIGSMIDWLIEEGYWTEQKGRIDATDFSLSGHKDNIIEHIEEKGLENELRLIVSELWTQIEKDSEVKRKKRYE